ncbi:MAG: hypothetical protein KGM44_10395 [bacterium]|nr:hypothetical protein [bacterium]
MRRASVGLALIASFAALPPLALASRFQRVAMVLPHPVIVPHPAPHPLVPPHPAVERPPAAEHARPGEAPRAAPRPPAAVPAAKLVAPGPQRAPIHVEPRVTPLPSPLIWRRMA